MRFAYADPPYHRMGKKMYGPLHAEAAVWDDKQAHIDLIAMLVDQYPDGWALSCNPADLRWLLPECPDTARVGSWVKTFHQIRPTSVQYSWEPVIWNGGRHISKRKPMVRDWLMCARGQNLGVPGAKPREFNLWVLELLGFDAFEDTITDLFPGSGGMGKAASVGRLDL